MESLWRKNGTIDLISLQSVLRNGSEGLSSTDIRDWSEGRNAEKWWRRDFILCNNMKKEEKIFLMRSLKIKALYIRFTRYNCPLYLEEKYKKVTSVRDTDFEWAYYIINMFDENNQGLLWSTLNEEEKSEFWKHFYPYIRHQCQQ